MPSTIPSNPSLELPTWNWGTTPRSALVPMTFSPYRFSIRRFRRSPVRRLLDDCPIELSQFLDASVERVLGEPEPFAPGEEAYGAALGAWRVLRSRTVPGVGKVRASKVLARKRPRLIHVVDDRIKEVLGLDGEHDVWQVFDEAMRDVVIVQKLAGLSVPASVPPLKSSTPCCGCSVVGHGT